MIFDFEMIDSFYKQLNSRILEIRKKLNHPLTLERKNSFQSYLSSKSDKTI